MNMNTSQNQTAFAAPHVLPLKIYLGVGALLLILTGVTVGVSFVPLGGFNVVVALLIASVKALLVALIFMHLLWDHKILLIFFVTAIVILTIFIALTMFDTMERGLVNPETRSPIQQDAIIYQNQQQPANTNGTGGH